jgi:hypothetical protein
LFIVASAALPLHAQLSAGAGFGAAAQQQTSDAWRSATRFEPTMRLDGRWLQMNGVASLLSGTSQFMRLDSGSVGFIASPPPIGAFRLTTSGSIARQTAGPAVQRITGTLESALSARIGSWGGWFGFASQQTREISTESTKPQLRMGLWRQFGDVNVSLSRDASAYKLSKTITTGPFGRDSLRGTYAWANTQARVGWAVSGVYFDTRFGMQPKIANNPQAMWGSASATVALNSRLALVAEAGNQPVNPTLNLPAKKFASLGVRIAPSALLHPAPSPNIRPVAANFALHPIGNQDYVVSLRVPSARVVELSGDFNGWKPIALHETRPDVWETTVTLHAGTYHMNVRVNGDAWTAPPGLPSTTDDFNGTVGLVVVR